MQGLLRKAESQNLYVLPTVFRQNLRKRKAKHQLRTRMYII